MILEICANSVQSCINAELGGADRVELCDNLYEGGTTPSAATIKLALEKTNLKVFSMIRPRGGDFCYSDLELDIMKEDIRIAKSLGVHGVVFGILKPDGNFDIKRMEQLVALARPLEITAHRAIDVSADILKNLELLITLGVDRVLTSGGYPKAIDGIEVLKKMNQQAEGKIKIMAGSGIRANNIYHFINIGIKEFHLSGKIKIDGKMTFRDTLINMGGLPDIPEYEIEVTSVEKVKAVKNILRLRK